MYWWLWLVLGLVLLGLEAITPGGFYVLFFGVGALVVGTAAGFGVGGPVWAQWLLFSVISVASLLLFRPYLLRVTRSQERPDPVDTLEGEIALPLEDISPGAVGKAAGVAATAVPGALLEPALVAAQASLDPFGALVEARIGVVSRPGRLDRDPRGEVDHAIGPEARALARHRDVAGVGAVEVLGERARDPRLHLSPQRLANVHVLAGHPQARHGRSSVAGFAGQHCRPREAVLQEL